MSVHMDTVPQPLGTVAPERGLFQTDMLAVRLKFRLTWILRHPSAVAWVQGVSW
jgi:hypothetical protein